MMSQYSPFAEVHPAPYSPFNPPSNDKILSFIDSNASHFVTSEITNTHAPVVTIFLTCNLSIFDDARRTALRHSRLSIFLRRRVRRTQSTMACRRRTSKATRRDRRQRRWEQSRIEGTTAGALSQLLLRHHAVNTHLLTLRPLFRFNIRDVRLNLLKDTSREGLVNGGTGVSIMCMAVCWDCQALLGGLQMMLRWLLKDRRRKMAMRNRDACNGSLVRLLFRGVYCLCMADGVEDDNCVAL